MRQLRLCCHIFIAKRVEKSDNKVSTSFVVAFSLPIGEKNVTSQNVEVTDAKGSLPQGFTYVLRLYQSDCKNIQCSRENSH